MLIGVSLVLADGALTPAVSVLGAVSGLSIAYSGLTTYIVAISIVILIGVFCVQPLGTSRIGVSFGPIMLLWFFYLFASGVYRISEDSRCLRALSPVLAVKHIFAHGSQNFFQLAPLFLCVTGLEALYADVGHFSPMPVRCGWLFVVLPALMAQYLGQTSLLIRYPQAIENPFFRLPPRYLYWPVLVLSTCAATIASQGASAPFTSLHFCKVTSLCHLYVYCDSHSSDKPSDRTISHC